MANPMPYTQTNLLTLSPAELLLILDLLALQKTQTLKVKPRGLLMDIENRLDQFIEQTKNKKHDKA
jgi:hypothetical protein